MVQAVKNPEPEKESSGIDSLTAAETSMAERKAAQSIATLGNEKYPQVGLIGALGWVFARRSEPKLTYENYMGTRTLTQISEELGMTENAAEDSGKEPGEST